MHICKKGTKKKFEMVDNFSKQEDGSIHIFLSNEIVNHCNIFMKDFLIKEHDGTKMDSRECSAGIYVGKSVSDDTG